MDFLRHIGQNNKTKIKWGEKMFTGSKTGTWMAGMGIGLAVGATAAAAGTMMMSKSTVKSAKKTAAKCAKKVGCMLDGIASMM